MLALRKAGPHPGLALHDVPAPVVERPDDVVIEVAAAGVCGSDLHIAHWAPSFHHLAPHLPVTLGHEFCGRVVDAGRSASHWHGRKVTVVPPTTCGVCDACRRGDRQACEHRKGIGILRDGAFARFVVVPAANCLAVPETLDDELAALAEPMAICAGAVRRAGLRTGERVIVFGPGTIGQGLALAARRLGASVTVVGHGDGARLGVLRGLGFDDLVDVSDPDAARDLRARRETFDCAFEAAGVSRAFEDAVASLAPAGRVVVVGIHATPAPADLLRLVRSRLSVLGAFSSSPDDWPGVIADIAADPSTYRALVTHRFRLADALAAVATAERREASKVILLP